MRPLSSHFPSDALTTLDDFMKQAKKTRVFRRAQAVRQVVAGHTVKATSETFNFTNSALRKWVKRFAREGTQGLVDRPGQIDLTPSRMRSKPVSIVFSNKTP
jgi:transposase-like protein